MKKKILIIIESLTIGGTEKSLISFLNELDYNVYDVDLQLFYKQGEFLSHVPKEVNLLEPLLDLHYGYELSKLIKNCKFDIVIEKGICKLIHLIYKDSIKTEVLGWKVRKLRFKRTQKYDYALSYMHHSSCLLYLVDKVKANKKFCYIHSDFQFIKSDTTYYLKYLKKLNKIFTVGKGPKTSLILKFPQLEEKLVIMPNIISRKEIIKKGTEYSLSRDNNETINILTVARLEDIKGVDIALEACSLVIKKGINIKWYIIGEGRLKNQLEQKILKSKLEHNFILLGAKSNPYPYMKNCDIYVQPSRNEARPIAVDEAKIFEKPIIVTNYLEAKNQIEDGVTGLISNPTAEMICEKIVMMKTKDARDKFRNNLIIENNKAANQCTDFIKLYLED